MAVTHVSVFAVGSRDAQDRVRAFTIKSALSNFLKIFVTVYEIHEKAHVRLYVN
jgi:hypothetical protein